MYLRAQHSQSELIFGNPVATRFPWEGREHAISPADGTIVLFPSFLEHRVTPHTSEV
jgi:hypothetical protein